MKADLPYSLKGSLVELANRNFPNEICGFVVKDNYGHLDFTMCRNIHPDPEHHFEIHHDDLRKAFENEERLVGMYHSHPRGPDGPSEADRKYAPDYGLRYFIVTMDNVYEYEMKEGQ